MTEGGSGGGVHCIFVIVSKCHGSSDERCAGDNVTIRIPSHSHDFILTPVVNEGSVYRVFVTSSSTVRTHH